eukprot:TRINITY_DN16955_c0_g1_i1.p1 TRINITY_DN16955_c0_g1~~TRINITY_DN16955_c0_g1_i1.p1  ORF type:complete len:377 (-),score=72.11 TRINITY_DN16955_c0_g1_i1:157-1287(-)
MRRTTGGSKLARFGRSTADGVISINYEDIGDDSSFISMSSESSEFDEWEPDPSWVEDVSLTEMLSMSRKKRKKSKKKEVENLTVHETKGISGSESRLSTRKALRHRSSSLDANNLRDHFKKKAKELPKKRAQKRSRHSDRSSKKRESTHKRKKSKAKLKVKKGGSLILKKKKNTPNTSNVRDEETGSDDCSGTGNESDERPCKDALTLLEQYFPESAVLLEVDQAENLAKPTEAEPHTKRRKIGRAIKRSKSWFGNNNESNKVQKDDKIQANKTQNKEVGATKHKSKKKRHRKSSRSRHSPGHDKSHSFSNSPNGSIRQKKKAGSFVSTVRRCKKEESRGQNRPPADLQNWKSDRNLQKIKKTRRKKKGSHITKRT